nr:uncharacterized protein LOC117846021 [Setaria viridis]
MAEEPGEGYKTPKLLDPRVDAVHRSFMSAIRGANLGMLRARVPLLTMSIYARWIPRLRAAGLLPIARLVEGDMVDTGVKRVDKMTHFYSDMSLLAALLDCWEPKTHMFHLTVGEMAPTLQDALLLLGLPCAGRAVGEQDVPDSWCEEFLDRFAHVQLHTRTHKEVVHVVQCRLHKSRHRRRHSCEALGGVLTMAFWVAHVLHVPRELGAEAPPSLCEGYSGGPA